MIKSEYLYAKGFCPECEEVVTVRIHMVSYENKDGSFEVIETTECYVCGEDMKDEEIEVE